ncbi:hypothetical protein R1sor_012958 [Riccia sorocarpa]|uniref:Uncharacterized protein n=1 Tax=Riccia sorocarpa TaxID=122646 RepID=A0ABD3I568_9MARC
MSRASDRWDRNAGLGLTSGTVGVHVEESIETWIGIGNAEFMPLETGLPSRSEILAAIAESSSSADIHAIVAVETVAERANDEQRSRPDVATMEGQQTGKSSGVLKSWNRGYLEAEANSRTNL